MVTARTIARSISRPVVEQLHKGQSTARVLATFEHACDLITPDGGVVALVTSKIGDGPFNIVLDGGAGLFSRVDRGALVILQEDRLSVGGLEVDLEGAAAWEPRPDWETLRSWRVLITSFLPFLHAICLDHVPTGSLMTLVGASSRDDAFAEAIFYTAQKATEALQDGWAGDLERLQAGGAEMAGLGNGLTPAGDDFLTGLMLWARLAHPEPDLLCQALVKAAAPRTTTLSAAFLRSAARGECSASWHTLLAALSEGVEARIAAAVQEVLARGATSGADSLSGFLCFGSGF